MRRLRGLVWKRISIVWLCVLLVAGMFPAITFAEDAPVQVERSLEQSSPLAAYADLPDRAFYLEALAFLTQRGVIEPNEEGDFAAEEPVTRAEFAKWLALSLGLKPQHESAFTDVPAASAEAPYIQALYQLGLVNGYGDGTFRGDQPITRAEAAALLAGISGDAEAFAGYATVFSDVHVEAWYAGAVGMLTNQRVIRGRSDGTFAPSAAVTRGETVALLYRLLYEERRIEDLQEDAVTINGQAYQWDDSLAGLFRVSNRDALLNAAIRYVNEGDTIVSVTGLELRAADRGNVRNTSVVFDGGGAVIDGSLYVSTDYTILVDLHIKQNLVITELSREAILLYGVYAEGTLVLEPAAGDASGNASDDGFKLLYAGFASERGWVISREADIVNLAESQMSLVPVTADEEGTAAKGARPVVIAQYNNGMELFSPDWYLERYPDVAAAVEAGLITVQNHFLMNGRYENRSPGPLFDVELYLRNNPDVMEAVQQGLTTPYDHFVQFGLDEGRRPFGEIEPEISLTPSLDLEEAEELGIVSEFALYIETGLFTQRLIDRTNPLLGYLEQNSDWLHHLDDTILNRSIMPIEERTEQRLEMSLHFVQQVALTYRGEASLTIVEDNFDSSNITINAESEFLELELVSPSEQNEIVVEINGNITQVDILGDYNGNIIFTGTGSIDNISVSDEELDNLHIELEGDLMEMTTVNGRAPSLPPTPPPSPSPPPRPPAPPVYHPSVTQVVYEAVHVHHGEFKVATVDAKYVYYAVMFMGQDVPVAERLIEWASDEHNPFVSGKVPVSGGEAVITAFSLAESENFVLYAMAEAPDGKLSEIFQHTFMTNAVDIVDVTHELLPDRELNIAVKLNALNDTPVYWVLSTEVDLDLAPVEVKDIAGEGCNAEPYPYCGKEMSEEDSSTAHILIASIDPGLYRLYVVAEGLALSAVYTLEIGVSEPV